MLETEHLQLNVELPFNSGKYISIIFNKLVRYLMLTSFSSVFAAKCFTMPRTLPKYVMQLCSRPCV